MKRTKIVAGNWKMNKTFQEADELIGDLLEIMDEKGKPENVDIVLCPPFLFLELAGDMVEEMQLYIGGQNVSEFESGAYTGEVSAAMLASVKADFCIIGHSERRKYFSEDDSTLFKKLNALLKHNITPIFCCGEVLVEREAGQYKEVVKRQLEDTVFSLNKEDFTTVVIAYEPVWAIGTGVTATPEQAQEMHAYIRALIQEKFGEEVAGNTQILYGGSCNSKNAAELFSQQDVDGGLIGGASLVAEEFYKIIEAAAE